MSGRSRLTLILRARCESRNANTPPAEYEKQYYQDKSGRLEPAGLDERSLREPGVIQNGAQPCQRRRFVGVSAENSHVVCPPVAARRAARRQAGVRAQAAMNIGITMLHAPSIASARIRASSASTSISVGATAPKRPDIGSRLRMVVAM